MMCRLAFVNLSIFKSVDFCLSDVIKFHNDRGSMSRYDGHMAVSLFFVRPMLLFVF